MPKLSTFLWFEENAEEAVQLYTSIFKHSRIVSSMRAPAGGPRPAGSLLTIDFELEGQRFVALNGGQYFKFNEAISIAVSCETQAEVDELWAKLTAGGEPSHCGWLKDKFGLSWQIVPKTLLELLQDSDPKKASRVMAAMLKMSKIDIAALKQAANNK